MNTLTALLLTVLACSTLEFASAAQNFHYPEESFNRLFLDLDTPYDLTQFNLLLNEESTHDLFNQEDVFASDAFNVFAEAGFNFEDGEISLDNILFSNEEAYGFLDLISNTNYNTDRLFEDNGFYQAPAEQARENALDNFNEEINSALFELRNGEEKLDIIISALIFNAAKNMENGEAETVFPVALSGVAAAAVDAMLNGVEGEQEKGEENLEDRYHAVFVNEVKTSPTETSSMNLYLAIGCVSVALLVIGAVVIGVRNLRKHEEAAEQYDGSNYVPIRN